MSITTDLSQGPETQQAADLIPLFLPGGHAGATIDGDADGRPDAVVVERDGQLFVEILPGGHADGLGDPMLVGAPPATIDLDGDGRPDGILVNTGGGLVLADGGVFPTEGGAGDGPLPVDFALSFAPTTLFGSDMFTSAPMGDFAAAVA